MRVESRLFLYLIGFFAPITLVYGFWTRWAEPIGLTSLLLTSLLFLLTGFYLWRTGKELPFRPEDNPKGEISDAEGDYGYFVASSWTPLWLGLSSAVMFAGLAIGWWLFIIGAIFGVVALLLWVFESFSGEYSI